MKMSWMGNVSRRVKQQMAKALGKAEETKAAAMATEAPVAKVEPAKAEPKKHSSGGPNYTAPHGIRKWHRKNHRNARRINHMAA